MKDDRGLYVKRAQCTFSQFRLQDSSYWLSSANIPIHHYTQADKVADNDPNLLVYRVSTGNNVLSKRKNTH